ncbi:hypothetical protein LTR62_005201 [Meristemomyces frigidus]|uniref:DHHA2 domain-containing protein n=1 Tax=Meristemomyces frigidus TaxID=1508187 RepID=A0AAN7TEZ4_9PEZI|nr:hypothetical protein LTR62_005201 [Meristemomyces frigidus]
MSRMPVRTFLVKAKRHLQQVIHNRTSASFVIGNESADLDSITCALVYGYIQSSTRQAQRNSDFIIPVVNIPAADLPLRPELTSLLKHAGLEPKDLITLDDLQPLPLPLTNTRWTLVDHNALTGLLGTHYSTTIISLIDHHEDEHIVPISANPRILTIAGSCSSLVANFLRPTWEDLSSTSSVVGAANAQSSDGVIDDFAYTSGWDAQAAKLALGSILIDTFNLTDAHKTTDHDHKAVRYLEAKINASPQYGKDYDRDRFFNEINTAKSDLGALSIEDILRKDYKSWTEGGKKLGMSTVVRPLQYLLDKQAGGPFLQVLRDFSKKCDLDLLAVMTAYTSEESGKFARELLLLVPDNDQNASGSRAVAETFVERFNEELALTEVRPQFDNGVANAYWLRMWEQGNVSASRKQVGPMLRRCMGG